MATTHLGGTASDVVVGKIGHGLMLMTWKPDPVPDEQCFATILKALEKVGPDAKLFVNSGEFYGINPRTANLELVARFFEKYPELADRVFLSVKGGIHAAEPRPDCSEENLRKSVDNVLKSLNGKKKLDLFEPARVDPNVSIEDTITTLSQLVKEGKFDHIGISEASAETLKRANKIHPIVAVEIEVSPWSYEEETHKVIAAARDLGVTVAAYSPLGHGFLTGKYQPEVFKDRGSHTDRFKVENAEHNYKIVQKLVEIADRKGITAAQLCLAWVNALGQHIVPIPGYSHPNRAEENQAASTITLTPEDIAEVNKVVKEGGVKGGRYGPAPAYLWG